MPLKLFEDLKYSYVDPKEVLKNKARFKSDLGEIRRGGSNKSMDQKITIKNATNFFGLREKKLICLEVFPFCYLKLSTKQNMEKDLKH